MPMGAVFRYSVVRGVNDDSEGNAEGNAFKEKLR